VKITKIVPPKAYNRFGWHITSVKTKKASFKFVQKGETVGLFIDQAMVSRDGKKAYFFDLSNCQAEELDGLRAFFDRLRDGS